MRASTDVREGQMNEQANDPSLLQATPADATAVAARTPWWRRHRLRMGRVVLYAAVLGVAALLTTASWW
jgi:hypothetical protein